LYIIGVETYKKDKTGKVKKGTTRGILKKCYNPDYEKYKLMFGSNKKTLESSKNVSAKHRDFNVARQTDFIKDFLRQHKHKKAPYSITQFDKHCWKCFGRELVCSSKDTKL